MAINVLLKRSTTASKRPTAAQLDIGELSLNYDANTAGVFFEDSAGNVRKVGPAEVSATAPNASPAGSSGNSLGELWYDTVTSSLNIWTGSSFVAVGGGGGGGTPGGSTTEVQFNSAGAFAGSSNFTFDGTTVSTAGLVVTGSSIFRAAATQDGVAIVGRAGGTSSYEVTFTPTTLTADRTQTLQDAAGTVALSGNNLSFFAATTSAQLAGVISDETGSGALVFATSPSLTTPAIGAATGTSLVATGAAGFLTRAAATQDGIELIGRAGGTTSLKATITPTTLTANRTITLPNVTGTVITTGDTGSITSTMIADNTIVNTDINSAAAIVDTKLATISTAGKVSNSATTATSANTASAIVARDGSGNFTAGTITAALTGAASSNVLKAGDTMTGALAHPLGSAGTPSITFTGDSNTGIYSPSADLLAIATGGAERLRVDANGLGRVGATTGDARIEVGVGATGNRNAYIDFVTDTTYTDYGLRLFRSNSGANSLSRLEHRGTNELRLACNDSAALTFHTSNSERMRITNDGRVYIGHTSTVGAPGAIAPKGYVGRSGLNGSFVNVFNVAWNGSNANLWIDTSNIGTIVTSSDYRIKKNIQTQTAPAIERIKQLRPVTYELKDYGDIFKADGIVREGFIAHEVQEVIPSGAEGEKDEENRVQNLRTDAIVAVLTKALQEAIAKIEALEALFHETDFDR